MEKERKGIILSNPMERYVELDHNYFYKIHKMNVISKNGRKIYYDDEDKRIIKPEIDYNMVISSFKDNDRNLYFVVGRKDNKLEVMPVKRTDEKMPRNIFKEIRKINDEVSDYVKFNEIKKINIEQSFNVEYFTTLDDYSYIISIYKNLINKKSNFKNKLKYEFGDVLSLYGTSEKFIFVCARNRFVYACNMDSIELFSGMQRINNDNIIEKYNELNNVEKKKLLSNLQRALELDKYIPKKIKDDVSMVLKQKNN